MFDVYRSISNFRRFFLIFYRVKQFFFPCIFFIIHSVFVEPQSYLLASCISLELLISCLYFSSWLRLKLLFVMLWTWISEHVF